MRASAEFQALFQQGKRIDRLSFVVLWREGHGPRRAGFAVSRQVRGAVQRNRMKRRLREAYRLARQNAPDSVVVVVIGKARALTERFEVLTQQMREAFDVMPGRRPRV